MTNKLDKVIQERAPLIFNDNLTGKILKLLLNKLFKYEETKNTLRVINKLPFNDVFSCLCFFCEMLPFFPPSDFTWTFISLLNLFAA